MDLARLLRGLRIAWTVGWGIVCVLLIVLWMRSFRCGDVATLPMLSSHAVGLVSFDGQLVISLSQIPNDLQGLTARFSTHPPNTFEPVTTRWNIGSQATPYPAKFVAAPHWLASMVFGTIAFAPWIHRVRQFSLRTLLIATTLIAVVLGLVVWSMQ